MCQRQDGWVDQLPHPSLSHFFTSAKTQVRNLCKGETDVTHHRRVRGEDEIDINGSIVVASIPTFRTTWTKSLEFCGLRPCIWRVQASREEAWATIRTVFPVWKRLDICWNLHLLWHAEHALNCGCTEKKTCNIMKPWTHFQFHFTQILALGQDLSGYLEASADVGVVGLWHCQLTYRIMRSGDKNRDRRLKSNLTPRPPFFQLIINVFGYQVMLLIDSGPTPDILVKVFQFGVFYLKNKWVTALYGFKPGYYKWILPLVETRPMTF